MSRTVEDAGPYKFEGEVCGKQYCDQKFYTGSLIPSLRANAQCHPSLRKGLFRDLTLGRGRTQGRPCHPERSIAKSNCEAVRRRSRAGSRAGTESFHRRSRCYASPCGFDYGGDSHRLPTASAQDDTQGDTSFRYVALGSPPHPFTQEEAFLISLPP